MAFMSIFPIKLKKPDALGLTKEEKELLVDEFYNRILDLLHLHGKEQIRKELERVYPEMDLFDTHQTITYHYSVEMVTGDIFQVVGRKRREK